MNEFKRTPGHCALDIDTSASLEEVIDLLRHLRDKGFQGPLDRIEYAPQDMGLERLGFVFKHFTAPYVPSAEEKK